MIRFGKLAVGKQ